MLAIVVACGVGVAAASGCASTSEWSVSEARTCAPKAPPRVCVSAGPDYGHVVELADVELLPGECAVADTQARGGLLHVQTRDPRRQRRGRWLGAPRGKTTIVQVQASGKPTRAGRFACDQTPVSVSVSVDAAARRE